MHKVSQEILLQRAEKEFLQAEYQQALRLYGLILKDYPNLDDAKVGVYLSDLGIESSDEAQALFDYYLVIRLEKENTVDIIKDLIYSLDSTKKELSELLTDPFDEQMEYADGIRYSDFLSLIESRGSFKKAFEDIMFSTKVVIRDKTEFINFVKQLADEGFNEMALGYLDATATMFGNDQEVLALYNVVKGKRSENSI